MKLGLANKNAVITGGSAGIGFAAAKALAEEGANILIIGRDKSRLQQAESELSSCAKDTSAAIHSISADLSEKESLDRAIHTVFSTFERIDFLVNSAGSAPAGSFFEGKDEDFLQAWNLKLLGYIRMVRAVGRHMMSNRSGKIVNIIGAAGRTPNPAFLPGSTTNAALVAFTKGISKELAPYNVSINAISPGVTATERAHKLAEQNAKIKGITVEEQKENVLSAIPLGHMVEPNEIADMTLLLLSERMSSMTGTEIMIDGGQQPGI
ncbi:3-oxoacyl-[acyl-carrier protein] reductase/bacilysin biosynthesis oxidoreductase BacG [Alteribacillus persepolensis]|uniref:3-oxoacyl-[acyl-carrier protein] reductase/bacilysin biosynthesis oxidoreductase BacG n=1 Tax=Alteribacillus persepolensis TaxID=568899 RepID=A0A1G8GYG3_9BACI|nr:SDR family oxidoreductase [Alteribacillus persepolensis]SDH99270.1 3-oxoacyl-[acyl-carrier protein] reductase/bacilysin biosynthesis oxidoreductase BacG [Alteribacillus persepolensis]